MKNILFILFYFITTFCFGQKDTLVSFKTFDFSNIHFSSNNSAIKINCDSTSYNILIELDSINPTTGNWSATLTNKSQHILYFDRANNSDNIFWIAQSFPEIIPPKSQFKITGAMNFAFNHFAFNRNPSIDFLIYENDNRIGIAKYTYKISVHIIGYVK
ncbi:MAG: hypothetical protein HY064_16005 [Bacteroidetes bacterium]|nr:hypothetical protein [Bacteroidota bacterium]